MAKSSVMFTSCSMLMAAIFAYSASVQLNDNDWYFWFPLYAFACLVNLVNWAISSKAMIRLITKVTLGLAIFLFVKVFIEAFVTGKAGFWSLDLSERVVREKTGSGLVIISMILHLEASSSQPKQSISRKERKQKGFTRYIDYGMAILVTFSVGLPFVFFVVKHGEMKFDHTNDGHS